MQQLVPLLGLVFTLGSVRFGFGFGFEFGVQIPITDMGNFLAAVRVVSLFKSCLMRKILIFLSFHVGGGNCVSI